MKIPAQPKKTSTTAHNLCLQDPSSLFWMERADILPNFLIGVLVFILPPHAAPLHCSLEEHFSLLQGIHLPSCQPPTDHLLLCLLPLCVCNSKRLPNKDFSLTFPPLDQLPPPPGLLHHRPSSPPSPLWQAPPRSGTSGSQKWVFGQSHYNQY